MATLKQKHRKRTKRTKQKNRNKTAKGHHKQRPTKLDRSLSRSRSRSHFITKKHRKNRGCFSKTCTICIDQNFKNKDLKKFAKTPFNKFNSFKLECNHCFHIPCIKQWINTKKECPNCKRPINAKTIKDILDEEEEYDQHDPFDNSNRGQEDEDEDDSYARMMFPNMFEESSNSRSRSRSRSNSRSRSSSQSDDEDTSFDMGLLRETYGNR